jgi:hypothetical protein
MTEPDHANSARGRALDLFEIRGRGTAVVVDIIDGVWRSGAQLVCAKARYRIRAVEAVHGTHLPRTAIALLVDDGRVRQGVVVGEEVSSMP